MDKVVAYTDGACSGNPGKGGWGVILLYGSVKKVFSGFEVLTTNNRMELQAVIVALRILKRSCDVTVYTDSMYVKNGFEQWMKNWKASGWLNSQKKAVKNRDLWEELDLQSSRHTLSFRWVKGHSGDPYNEEVDFLAKGAIDSVNESRT